MSLELENEIKQLEKILPTHDIKLFSGRSNSALSQEIADFSFSLSTLVGTMIIMLTILAVSASVSAINGISAWLTFDELFPLFLQAENLHLEHQLALKGVAFGPVLAQELPGQETRKLLLRPAHEDDAALGQGVGHGGSVDDGQPVIAVKDKQPCRDTQHQRDDQAPDQPFPPGGTPDPPHLANQLIVPGMIDLHPHTPCFRCRRCFRTVPGRTASA